MIPEYMIDFAKQLEIYINSDYYKDQISIGAFSTRFRKFFLENERAKDLLFMIDVLNGETEEKNKCLDLLESISNGFQWRIDNEPETIDKGDFDMMLEVNDCLRENGRLKEE
jgi:hypothetical protein